MPRLRKLIFLCVLSFYPKLLFVVPYVFKFKCRKRLKPRTRQNPSLFKSLGVTVCSLSRNFVRCRMFLTCLFFHNAIGFLDDEYTFVLFFLSLLCSLTNVVFFFITLLFRSTPNIFFILLSCSF